MADESERYDVTVDDVSEVSITAGPQKTCEKKRLDEESDVDVLWICKMIAEHPKSSFCKFVIFLICFKFLKLTLSN